MFGKRSGEVKFFGRFTSQLSRAEYAAQKQRVIEEVRQFCRDNFSRSPKQSESAPVFVKQVMDNRPYIELKLCDLKVVALLDSGANRSFVGRRGVRLLSQLNLKIRSPFCRYVTTADGKRQLVTGSVDLPLYIGSTCKIISALVVPSLNHSFILGMDFCKSFSMRVNFRDDTWHVCAEAVEMAAVEAERSPETDHLFSSDELTYSQRAQLEQVVSEFKDLGSDGRLGRTNKSYHIDTGEAKPIKQRQYLLSPYMLEHLYKELDRMLGLGVVEPSSSEWCSPVLLVKKSNGDFRFCFDGRKLNSVTKKDSYPLPHIDRILSMLSNSRFISSVDLRSAFWQIPLDQESKEKTAFAIPRRGLFHFNVLPFGLSNAAQCLQRLMDVIFGPELEPNVFVYLDDLIIVSQNFEEHIRLLKEVAHRLREANLTVNLDKCEFLRPSLKYLGFVVDKYGLRTDSEKISAMVNFPRPRTTTEVKRFVGMCGWYRRFIPHFSTRMSAINDLLKGKKKGQRLEWSDDAERAFIDIKQALVSAPILSSPDFSLPFVVQCDASDVGIGCVLTQEIDGSEKVIAFASRSLSKSERNYSVTERECLACIFACEKFRPYIEGTHFTVVTDHAALKWLHKIKDPIGRLARWSMRLNQFSFDIVHRKGKFNVVPDALSRSPVDNPLNRSGSLEAIELAAEDSIALDIDLDNLDHFYRNMRDRIKAKPQDFPQWCVKNQYVYKLIPSRVPLSTNTSDWKLLVPKAQRVKILRSCHDEPMAAHLGYAKTLSRVALTYYWPKMRRDIYRYIRACKICGSQKAANVPRFGLMGAEKKVRFPWQVVAVDLMGPLPRSNSGFCYLLVVTDWFTKYTLLKPLRTASAQSIVRYIEDDVFLVYGVPQTIICDNGTQFTGSVFKSMISEYKSRIWFTARYHAQANFVERYNRTIGTAIRSYIKENHKQWDKYIPKIAFALRTAVHEVTGYSPAFLNFGRVVPACGTYYGDISRANLEVADCKNYARDLGNLSDLYKDVQAKLRAAYERNAKTYNLRKRSVEFHVGDRVWKRNKVLSDASKDFAQKLAPRYVPCTVVRKVGNLVYELENQDGSNAGKWHVKELKPYCESASDLSDSCGE